MRSEVRRETRLVKNEFGADYVLLGKFSKCLKVRFGQHRKLARGKYDVSLRQVCEVKRIYATYAVCFETEAKWERCDLN